MPESKVIPTRPKPKPEESPKSLKSVRRGLGTNVASERLTESDAQYASDNGIRMGDLSSRTSMIAVFAMAVAVVGSRVEVHAQTQLAGTPFAERRTGPESTLFSTLEPESTGIVAPNRYADPDMWNRLYSEFTLGPIGTGVAIGDYDGDGRPDIFLAGKTDPDRLFRNLGDWRFEEVSSAAGISASVDAWKTGACFADVNNDGHLDLFVGRWNAPNLLYINQGDGTFVERGKASGLGIVDSTCMAALADFDRDGWIDVYLVTNLLDSVREPDGQPDYLFRNRGDGTFENVTARAGMSGRACGHSAVWWDFNDDGWPDIYVANDFGWPDQLWQNLGGGKFRDVVADVLPHIPRFAMGSDLGDADNDGRIDFLVADMMPRSRERDQRSLIDPRSRLVDVSEPGMAPQYMRAMLYVNTHTSHLLETAWMAGLAATDWTWSVRFEDLDNDGWLDVHMTNGMVRPFWDLDLRMQGDVSSRAEVMRRIKADPVMKEANLAFRNRGDLQFEEVGAAWGLDHMGVSLAAAFGDLDGDGDLDLVFGNFESNATVCRNNSTKGHRVIFDLQGTVSNRFGVGADVKVETPTRSFVRQLATARGYMSSSEPAVHVGLGDADRIVRVTITWPSGIEQVLENVRVDQRYRVVEPRNLPGIAQKQPAVALRQTSGQFVEVSEPMGLNAAMRERALDELAAQPLLPLRQNSLGPGVAIGDVNSDGRDDFVLGGTSLEPARVMVMQADGTYAASKQPALAQRAAVADAAPLLIEVNGDGWPDLLLPKGGVAKPAGDSAYRPQLFVNDRHGNFREAGQGELPELSSSVGPAVAADYNRDGTLDVFLGGRVVPGRYGRSPTSALWENRGGRFVDVTSEVAPGLANAGMVAAALWSDVDDDGWVDLLVAGPWGPVRFWRNLEGRSFEDASEQFGFAQAGTGWWNSIASGDFNADGRLDYIVGNLGLNTPYVASIREPITAFVGGFDDSGREHVVEAVWDREQLYPRRSRFSLSSAMPWIYKKHRSFREFAQAPISAIFPSDRLESAQRLEVTELRSGVFLSAKEGGYRFSPLPRLAQASPIQGIVVGDFNGDGFDDICVVQNTYAPIPEFGRFNGGLGLLMRGNGRGDFEPVLPEASGIIVPGDARGLARLDVDQDGWCELLVTRHAQTVLLFGNTGVPQATVWRVALRAGAGNPAAAGARLTLERKDGFRQTREVQAGGGYLSQSHAVAEFSLPRGPGAVQLLVRWPWGATKQVALPPGGGSVTISPGQ